MSENYVKEEKTDRRALKREGKFSRGPKERKYVCEHKNIGGGERGNIGGNTVLFIPSGQNGA